MILTFSCHSHCQTLSIILVACFCFVSPSRWTFLYSWFALKEYVCVSHFTCFESDAHDSALLTFTTVELKWAKLYYPLFELKNDHKLSITNDAKKKKCLWWSHFLVTNWQSSRRTLCILLSGHQHKLLCCIFFNRDADLMTKSSSHTSLTEMMGNRSCKSSKIWWRNTWTCKYD